jgi:hypothetical protein
MDQLWWQCRCLFQSEDGTVERKIFGSLGDWDANFDFSDTVSSHTMWCTWMNDFKYRRLTYETDRAPAIAGLVDFYQRKTGHTPLLGGWKETLQYDLASRFDQEPPGEGIPTGFPSWSWLSMRSTPGVRRHRPMTFPSQETSTLAVVESDIQWKGRPFSSTLLSSKLVISSLLRTVCDDATFQKLLLESKAPEDPMSECEFGYELSNDELQDLTVLHLYQTIFQPTNGEKWSDDPTGGPAQKKACRVFDSFLLLVPVSGSSRHVYRRVGRGWIRSTVPVQEADVGKNFLFICFKETDKKTVVLV